MSMEAIDRHYPDDELSALAATARVEEDAHLRSCRECAEKLEAFQLIAEALHDRAVWDTSELRTEPVPSTVATLRAFADAMAEDDAYGEEVLPELLAGSRETWMPRLQQHPEWRSAGVVRKLIEAASRAIDTMPPDAVEMTALATNIAERLDAAEYSADTIARLSGAAWRERAYALFYTGKYIDAEEAILASKRHFSESVENEYELARVDIVHALVLRALEQSSSAMRFAVSSATTFLEFEDVSRAVSARIAEVHVLFDRGDFAKAHALLTELERRMSRSSDAETHARVLSNLGWCCWKLNLIQEAVQCYEAGAVLLETLGIDVESARIRWQIASLLASVGRVADAEARFEQLQVTFENLGMTSVATLISLEIAELMLARGRFDAVESICRAAIRSFSAAGIPHGARALTALAYMAEAAQLRTATPALAKHVREYIRQLPVNANLLFAPPPD